MSLPTIQRPGWKVALPVLLALGALALAGLAYSFNGPNAQLVSQDRIYGGGSTDANACFIPDIGFCRTLPFNLAIDAHATGTGHAAHGDQNSGAVGFRDDHFQITCLAVDGHNAVVGGTLVSSSNPSLFAEYLVDRGTPAFGDRDLVSPAYGGPAGPGNWPPGFPFVCPSPDTDAPAFGLIRSFVPLTHGDIVVQDSVGH